MTFARPETFKVGCDVHPWMTAYVGVFDHPFFAVTGDGGRFEIQSVPPGTYTLVAWHDAWQREQEVRCRSRTSGEKPAGGVTFDVQAKRERDRAGGLAL